MGDNFVDVDDRGGRHRKLRADFRQRGARRCVVGALLTIHRNHEAGELDVGGGAQDRNGFADRSARGGHILDDEHAVAVLQLATNEKSALTVILGFLAVEAELNLAAALGERHRHGNDQRNALVRRAEQHIEAFGKRALDRVGVRAAELRKLYARAVLTRVYEVRRFAAAFGGEVAEGENTHLEHEVDEGSLIVVHGGRSYRGSAVR